MEILTDEECRLRPVHTLHTPATEIVQVRIVVWGVKAVPVEPENTALSLYVRGIVTTEEDTDGTATFNWRFVWNMPVPTRNSSIHLQLWNRNILTQHDAIGETFLELASDMFRCKRSKQAVRLSRQWFRLSHPAYIIENRGLIEVEIDVVPKLEADSFPVGLGREAPNMNPYLEPVKENRNALTSSSFAKKFWFATGRVKTGAQWCTWLVGVVVFVTILSFLTKIFR